MRRSIAPVVSVVLVVTMLGAACSDDSTTPNRSGSTSTLSSLPATTSTTPAQRGALVFNGTGNNLDAYSATPDQTGAFATQRVDKSAKNDPAAGRDINGQICFFPDDSGRFVAGEDTGQPDPPAGWGIFELSGSTIGDLGATQVAKLTPTYQAADDQPENYGCGFLSDGRIVTTDVGNQAGGEGTGQFIVWFPPFDSEQVAYCKIDLTLGTAQSILVGPDDSVYVAAARGGVYRYAPPFPTGADAGGGCDATDGTGAPTATSVARSVFIAAGDHDLATPAGLAPGPDATFFVSSVFNGIINQYSADGAYLTTVLRPPAGETLGAAPYSTGTPLGIGTGPDGSLYYADIGIVVSDRGVGPGSATGTVRRIAFVDGVAQPPETMASGLDFPDGIGVWTPPG